MICKGEKHERENKKFHNICGSDSRCLLLQNAFSLALPQEVSTPNLLLIVVCFLDLCVEATKE